MWIYMMELKIYIEFFFYFVFRSGNFYLDNDIYDF